MTFLVKTGPELAKASCYLENRSIMLQRRDFLGSMTTDVVN